MKNLEEMTLEEIKQLENKDYIEQYFTIVSDFQDNRFSKQILESLEGESINRIYQELIKSEEKIRSHTFFPGNLVLVYPNIKEQKSKDFKICDFSGSVIYPGSLYVNYRPLLDNITTNERFVLARTIHVEIGYQHNLPTSIAELEALEQDMLLETANKEIDFSHFNNQMGGKLPLKKLQKGRRKIYVKNRNSK